MVLIQGGDMARIALLFCVLLLAACERPVHRAELSCPEVEGLGNVLAAPGVFIGDMHGTNQSPAFLAALTCHVLASGRPVVVAMEYDAVDQAVLERFLLTQDDEEAMSLLTSTRHWIGNRDGRASTAMANALRALHGYVRQGARLKLAAYDFGGAGPAQRDAASAQFLEQRRAQENTNAYWILFGGNVHARKTRGLPQVPGYEDHEPLGYLLRNWGLVHLDAQYRGGELWGCTGASQTCGVIDLGPPCPAGCELRPVIRLGTQNEAYDGVYDVSMLSASSPLHWR